MTAIHCFKGPFHLGLEHQHDGKVAVGVDEIMQYATRSRIDCPVCGKETNPREAFFSTFGNPEALFGLDVWRGFKSLPATKEGQVLIWDLATDLPYDGPIVYANITNQVPDASTLDQSPSLMLWNQSPHQPWPTHLRFYVPPGSAGRAINLLVVVKPSGEVFDVPIELALQAVDAFHRHLFGVACVLLAASVEASLRARLEPLYQQRGVSLPQDGGFATHLERARMHFMPQPGPQLVGDLRELAKRGRNTAAHGQTQTVTRDEVARWMVDVAATYEWARHATPR